MSHRKNLVLFVISSQKFYWNIYRGSKKKIGMFENRDIKTRKFFCVAYKFLIILDNIYMLIYQKKNLLLCVTNI